MSVRARMVSMVVGISLLGASTGCGADVPLTATETETAPAPTVAEPAPVEGPVSDAALVAAARADIPPGTLPDGMYLTDEITAPGSTTADKVYATATYAGGAETGPVVVVGARPLTEENQSLVDGQRPGAVLLPEISPGAVLVSRDDGASVLVTDGTTLVQLVSTRYDAERLVAFVASVAETIDS